METRLTYSKFRVHNAIRTRLRSRYPISASKPGWGSCSAMAAVSMARMVAWAEDWAGGGREWMCSRMSVVLGIWRAVLRGGRVLDWGGFEGVEKGCEGMGIGWVGIAYRIWANM